MRARVGTACPTGTSGYTGAMAAQLEYDPMGRLYEVIGYTNGVQQQVTRMLYDGDALAGEYNTAGTMTARHIHGPAAGVDDPLISYAGTSTAIGNARYLYAGARGSVVFSSLSNASAPLVNSYDPYGVPGSTNSGRFQYTGQIWLAEAGLYYYKARMYSPALGRFLQTDPIGYEDNVNLYAYVGNDPVNGVDWSGLEEEKQQVTGSRIQNDMAGASFHASFLDDTHLTQVNEQDQSAEQQSTDNSSTQSVSESILTNITDGDTAMTRSISRDDRAILSDEMSEDEYQERARARAAGVVAGAGGHVVARVAPVAVRVAAPVARNVVAVEGRAAGMRYGRGRVGQIRFGRDRLILRLDRNRPNTHINVQGRIFGGRFNVHIPLW